MSSISVNDKFSVRLALKVHRLKKMLKPMLRFINSRKASRCTECAKSASASASAASSWAEDCDAENAANEALASRLQADLSSGPGGVLTAWVGGQWTLVGVAPGGRSQPLPVAFLAARDGGFLWAPLADSDVCLGAALSSGQTAEEQVPTAGSR